MAIKIKNKKRFLWIFWSVITLPIVSLILLLTIIAAGGFGELPTFEELENPKSNISTEIISEEGEQLGSFFIENRSFVDYGDLSPNLVAALVSTEDARFYGHSGIDYLGLVRVAFKSVLLGQNQGGGSTISQQLAKNLYPRDTVRYSSSISRNASLVVAKFKEWITATMLEYNYTKEEIIVMYLNVVEYGSNAYGIKSAAQTFFNKTPAELTVPEAALLVGVVNAPTRYSPIKNPERAKKRRNTVIERMYDNGFLSKKTRDSLQNSSITLDFRPVSHSQGTATYFRTMLRLFLTANKPEKTPYITEWDYNQLVKQWDNNPLYGWCNKNTKADGSKYNIYKDGLKIYTTINAKMQRYAEAAVVANMKEAVQPRFTAQKKARGTIFSNISKDEEKAIMRRAMRQTERYRVLKNEGISEDTIDKNFNTKTDVNLFSYTSPMGLDTVMTPYDSIMYSKSYLRSGLVAVEPSSGFLKAYVGGVDFKYFMYDMASQGKRQAGSTFKPFVYTFAIDQLGLNPCTPVPNLPVTVEGWSPKEAGKVEQVGELHPLWWGLAMSRNNYSAWIMKQAGQPAAVADFIYRMGIKSFIDPVPPLCVGTPDVSIMEMVAAYTNFVNMGVHIDPIFVTRIEDRHGNILATFSAQSYDAISQQSAFDMLGLLRNVIDRGTASKLRHTYKFVGEMGGKTGTTDNNSDAWFIGITPKIVAGTWVGGEDRSINLSSRGEGGVIALPAFARFMQSVYADPTLGITEKDFFVKPVGVTRFDCNTEDMTIEQIGVDKAKTDEDEFLL